MLVIHGKFLCAFDRRLIVKKGYTRRENGVMGRDQEIGPLINIAEKDS